MEMHESNGLAPGPAGSGWEEERGAEVGAQWRTRLPAAHRVVVKVGTSTLTDGAGGFNVSHMDQLASELARAADEGREVVLVTSGAIGAGMGRLGLKARPRTIPEKQGVAAIGQGLLMHMYQTLFERYGRVVAQLLLTRDDLTHRQRHLNSRNTFFSLWRMGAIPIVNENDTVAVDEIKFGNNDTLAALVAALVAADLLIVLSDVDGVYRRDPRVDPEAPLLSVVTRVDEALEEAAGGPGSDFGTGGMATKLQAAKIATAAGIATVVANGSRPGIIRSILRGDDVGTLFVPREEKMGGWKRWIAFYQSPRGRLHVDEGAVRALVDHGKSLLPIGIREIEGDFDEGDVVVVVDPRGSEVARGVVNYPRGDVAKIMGCSSKEIEERLGYKYYDEVIHRDNLVLS